MFSFTQISRAKPSAPPVPDEEDTLQFFDAVIASCDSEPLRKPYTDDGHADVDFIGEPESPVRTWRILQRGDGYSLYCNTLTDVMHRRSSII